MSLVYEKTNNGSWGDFCVKRKGHEEKIHVDQKKKKKTFNHAQLDHVTLINYVSGSLGPSTL